MASVEEIVLAIQQLHSDPVQNQSIQQQLIRLQKLPEAWELALMLIRHQDLNVQFFAAQTMHIKINRDWYVGLFSIVMIK
jgi:hypothetical protein